jgi:RNA polymerase sigma-70 factor, ECF subfamily
MLPAMEPQKAQPPWKDQEDQEDKDLLRKAVEAPEGDLRAFEKIVVKYRSRIVANCRYITRDSVHAEDLSQDIFLKLYFSLRRFEGRSSFRTWLYRMKLNHCLNFLKKESRNKYIQVDDPDIANHGHLIAQPAAEDFTANEDERLQVGAILDSLSDTLRVPLVMCDVDELSYQEVADAMGLNLSAVKMRIKRAREEFARLYQTHSKSIGHSA